MGGGDWQRQEQQIQTAYRQIKPVETTQPEWKPDYVDKIYIGVRTYVPSWVILACGIVGAITILLAIPGFKIVLNGIFKSWKRELN